MTETRPWPVAVVVGDDGTALTVVSETELELHRELHDQQRRAYLVYRPEPKR